MPARKLPLATPRPAEARPRLLVTGAGGFVGGFLAEALAAEYEVLAIPGRQGFAERLARLDADRPLSAIIHAGFDTDWRARPGRAESVESTRLVLELAEARGVPQLVFLSTAAALGVSGDPRPRDEQDLGTTDPGFEALRQTRYIQEKLACERVLGDARGVAVTRLYLSTVYGQGMSSWTRQALLSVDSPSPLVLCPPGGASYLGLADLLDVVLLVLDQRAAGGLVVSSGDASYAALYRAAAEVLGVADRVRILTVPSAARRPLALLARLPLAPPRALVEASFGFKHYSVARAAELLGWEPSVRLEDALAEALL